MAQAHAHPFADELHKAHPRLAELSLQQYSITGKASYDPATKKQSFEIQVVEAGRTFTGTVDNVNASDENPYTDIIGTITCMNPPSPDPAQSFTFTSSSAVLLLTFYNASGVPEKWLAASPVPGLTGGPFSGTGKWV